MNILMLHNYYQIRGGEDVSAEAEVRLLQEAGHNVDFRTVSNHAIEAKNRLTLARDTIWSSESYQKVRACLSQKTYDVMHVQNFFPKWSPSVFHAAKDMGVATVFSVRNYRLFCLNGLFYRNDQPCETCTRSFFLLPGILFRCYRSSRMASVTVAMMLNTHRLLNTWKRKVDRFITLSDFSRRKMIQSGFNPGRVVVKPNFVEPVADFVPPEQRKGIVYVGRLSEEKGVDVLLKAWLSLQPSHETLTVVGDGPLLAKVWSRARDNPTIRVLGRQPLSSVHCLLASAKILVQPSCCYETFGRAIAEALAYGTPVITTDIGAIASFIKASKAGLTFELGNTARFVDALRFLITDKAEWLRFHNNGLQYYQKHLTASSNISQLLRIYQSANLDIPMDC